MHLVSFCLSFMSLVIGYFSYSKLITAEAIDTSDVSETYLSFQVTDH